MSEDEKNKMIICPVCKTEFCMKEKEEENRYQVSDLSIITDTQTNLQWYVGPDKDTTWEEAKSWVDNLTIDGGGWRMPTRKELLGLYQNGKGNRNMDLIFKMTGWWVWASEVKDSSSAWYVAFDDGRDYYNDRSYSEYDRGFAVRSAR